MYIKFFTIHLKYTIFSIFLVLQIAFWLYTKDISPTFTITPYPPSQKEIDFISFGDTQATYRILGFKLQNAGDKFGHFSSMDQYDYSKLYHWFARLDGLDLQSQYIPYIAFYYYGNTHIKENLSKIVDFMLYDFQIGGNKRWHSLLNAALLEHVKIKDQNKVMELSLLLSQISTHDIALYARFFGIIIGNQYNRHCEVLEIGKRFNYELEKKKINKENYILLRFIEKIDKSLKDSANKCHY